MKPITTPLDALLEELADGYARNFDEGADTPFSFTEPLLTEALAVLTPEQIERLKRTAAWQGITKGREK